MKTPLEKVGKLASKTRKAQERNMVGPTGVPLEVLEAVLELAAGQGAVVERLESLEAQVDRSARGEPDARAEDPGDAPDLASRVEGIAARQRSLEDRWALEKAKRQALAAGLESIPGLTARVVDLAQAVGYVPVRTPGDQSCPAEATVDARLTALEEKGRVDEETIDKLNEKLRGVLDELPVIPPDAELPTRGEGTS